MDGILNIKPVIKKFSFNIRGRMNLVFKDGRTVEIPLTYFPSIRKLTDEQRKKWYVLDGELFSFDDCREVFHIEQILGKENNYRYTFSKKKTVK